jgi:alkyldihydroxyacetonephosphate synthase
LPGYPRTTGISYGKSAGLVDDVSGAANAVQDDLDRIVHTYGKSATDLLRIHAGDIPRVPDVVVYPGNEAEVQLIVDHAVAADAVIIPYGRGTSFSGSLRAPVRARPGRSSHLLLAG